MSVSDAATVDLIGVSDASDAATALGDALTQVQRGLAGAGCGPHHLDEMIWEARDPAAFHPARHAIDLAYREVFGGFRPKICLRRSDNAMLTVRANATAKPAPSGKTPWRGYDWPELARQYAPRLQVADMLGLFRTWTRDGEAFRRGHRGLDLAYGDGPYETLDLFYPTGVARPPLWVFLHGGYWQASDKNQHAQFARGMLDAGYAVAMPNYALAPDAPLTLIVRQTVAALRFLAREADALGVDADRMHVAGHSAGAHLAAMAAVHDDAPPLRSALLLSGLFDLAPLGLLPVGALLGLDKRALVDELSPIRFRPPSGLRIGVAVGALESDEFKWQSSAIATAWRAPAPLALEDAHHFSLLDGLNEGPLLDLARATAAN